MAAELLYTSQRAVRARTHLPFSAHNRSNETWSTNRRAPSLCKNPRLRNLVNTNKLKKCIPPSTSNTSPIFVLRLSSVSCGFVADAVRVYKEEDPGLWLECGTPGCDGSPMDWADYPWWDENHALTKAHDKACDEVLDADEPSHNPERN